LPLSKAAAIQLSIKLRHKADTELPRKLKSSARQLSDMLMDLLVKSTLSAK
jgi:Rod binding domain-containing protein